MRKRIYLGVFLLVVVLLAGCTGGGGSGGGDTLQLTISIYDSETKDLIEEDVYLALNDQAQTTSSGISVFRDVSPGTKRLQVSSPGYLNYVEDITVSTEKQAYDVYLTPDPSLYDSQLQFLVTNIRSAGISLTNVWEPQAARLERHIVDKVTPFAEELGDLLYVLMEPLNDPYFEFDVEYKDGRIYFSHIYTSSFRVEYSIDIVDFDSWIETGHQNFLNVSFSIHDQSDPIAQGQGQLNAVVTDPEIYYEWGRWLEDPETYPEPSELFFSAADLTADAWFQTPSFGRVVTDSEVAFVLDTMTLSADGTFESDVMYSQGELVMVLAEIEGLTDWELPIYPAELDFSGLLGFPNIAEVQGSLDVTFVPNQYYGSIVPSKARLDGSYKDLNSKGQEILAEGSFQYDWSKAATYQDDYNLGLTAGFAGFIQEPLRPKVSLTLDATFDSLLQGNVTIDYSFGSHYLRGSASVSNQVDSDGYLLSSSMSIKLKNEHDLQISLLLNENLSQPEPRIGDIQDKAGEVLAELGLVGGIPYIFYPDGHYESLF